MRGGDTLPPVAVREMMQNDASINRLAARQETGIFNILR